MPQIKTLRVFLIKPSKYDDDGYVIRYWKGVLPSNTLAVLYGLTEDVRKRGALGPGVNMKVHALDETVEKVPVREIIQSSRKKDTKTLICLAGVQSNQFSRASDLALQFRKAGLDVMIGGFHVSGIMATMKTLTPELKQLAEAGVSLVAGEAEGRWEGFLRDSLEGKLQPVYNYLNQTPDLSNAPIPVIPKNLLNRYAVRHFATLDCGRGCPYSCSFCTVINVQGRVMRFRPLDSIIEMVRRNFREKISYYFFTDDNFSRNKNWRPIFDALIKLRNEEKIPVTFMMQVDTQSHKIQDFAEKAAEAGCSQVFIGLESINPQNLEAAGKKQNKIAEYQDMILKYQSLGIATHLAYIIGFPFDTEESVRRDMALMQDLGANQASFFMLTPLPGSMDHKNGVEKGVFMDADLNNFDSFHETCRHPQMAPGAWTQAYEYAWKSFYGKENLVRILNNTPRPKYWDVFLNFIWYKNAIEVEGGHPMVHGFVRRKSRSERRPGFEPESRVAFAKRRVRDAVSLMRGWMNLFFDMQEVWLATRHRGALEEKVVNELQHITSGVKEWRQLRLSEIQALYELTLTSMEKKLFWKYRTSIPSRFQIWLNKWNVFYDNLTYTRQPMTLFWKKMFAKLKKGNIIRPMPLHQIAFMAAREVVLGVEFLMSILKGSGVVKEKS